MFRKFAVAAISVVLGIVTAFPSAADLQVKLRDGRVFTLPVWPDEVESFSFTPVPGRPHAGVGVAVPPQAPAPKTSPLAPSGVSAGPASASDKALPASGRILRVGPRREFKLPSQAAAQVRDGDLVEIDAADYIGDVAVWTRENLTLRGVGGGRAHLRADGRSAEGKAIWVIKGKNTRVESIEFSDAKVSDGNGAGIRLESPGLTVVNCFFHDNEEGILAGDVGGDVVVENSEFARNGNKTGRTHALYVNRVNSLTVKGSYFHDTIVGHHIKTRGLRNLILYNRILDRTQGTSSYAIDLSNGGQSLILGNVIQQGPMTENSGIIAYALEGATNDAQDLYVVNNTIVNDYQSGTFVHSRSGTPAQIVNNIMVGPGVVLRGPGRLADNLLVARGGGAPVVESGSDASDRNKRAADARFVDAKAFDYRLLADSPARGAGIDPGQANGFSLIPEFQPSASLGLLRRPHAAAPDLGAFQYERP